MQKPPADQKNSKQILQRKAKAIARRYGDIIGRYGIYWATARFKPKPDSFDADGKLTFDAACDLIRLIGKSAPDIADNTIGVWREMTKDELSTMREHQGLPPV